MLMNSYLLILWLSSSLEYRVHGFLFCVVLPGPIIVVHSRCQTNMYCMMDRWAGLCFSSAFCVAPRFRGFSEPLGRKGWLRVQGAWSFLAPNFSQSDPTFIALFTCFIWLVYLFITLTFRSILQPKASWNTTGSHCLLIIWWIIEKNT